MTQPIPWPTDPEVTEALAADHGLTVDEYRRLCDALGRTPTYTELGIASVMWSEHCSYKSSRIHLSQFPTDGPQVIQGPGENAGVVDIGDGQAVVFKMESHNHPSFIEPYQGAATGVGGICRDVFTMGARPIALADCLRFGRPDHPRTPYLLSGVVRGIGDYGNSFGVPNVAGDVAFDASYDGNILVNAFCLGLARADRIFYGTASGVGNAVMYVGAKTGRDGIHGATMASAEFGDDAEAKRPTVQVGDPFMEKLLLEACLELMELDLLVGIQDMGAAGLTSSSVEMAARAGSGIELDLDAVPVRERNMTPYELMLSESQERMLMVVEAGREAEAMAVFDKWDLDAAVVGRVTDTGRVVARMAGAVRADLPAGLLADGLKYDRPRRRPAYLDDVATLDVDAVPAPGDLAEALLRVLGSPNVASKEWVYRQYDHNVRHGTVARPGMADAGVVRVVSPDGARQKGVAIAAGCNQRMVYLDPYEGARLVVAEAYANLVATGARPLAVTDCLNFGSPENPEIMWQFAEAVRGLADACRALGTPVVSGNVSLYNETDGAAIKPTPMIAMVGLLDDAAARVTCFFRGPGRTVALVGAPVGALAGSEYLAALHGIERGKPAPLDVGAARAAFDTMLALADARLLDSAHDVSDGGLACALAECCVAGPERVGAAVDLTELAPGARPDEILFSEGPARFVVSFAPSVRDQVEAIARERGAPLRVLGTTGGDVLDLGLCRVAVDALADAWETGFRAVVK
ncbi:MAG: phosphoribosylformylglycinamidine synthase subunit PurL [Deltaproteobacteria bacterium]|nr:MAG: phosphoribosylformylglycinamidine synthase subunit PurL [Deltaproteobacteria bacterium]